MVEKVSKLRLTFSAIANIIASVTIVVINKWIYTHYGFPNLTLNLIHFIETSFGLVLCKSLGIFQPKALPVKEMIKLSLVFCGFVVLTNLSLETNTVETYQLFKSLTTPILMLIQATFYNMEFTTRIKSTVIPILIGVVFNCFNDVQFNRLGLLYGAAGVILTALYQVWVGEKQRELQCDCMQLLYYQAPLSASLLILIVPFLEPMTGDFGLFGAWSYEAVIMVMISGFFAFSINLSLFWIIGNTSPLTYNIIGHLKFCLTLFCGYFIFEQDVNGLQILSAIITFMGIVSYSVLALTTDRPLPSVRFIGTKERSN